LDSKGKSQRGKGNEQKLIFRIRDKGRGKRGGGDLSKRRIRRELRESRRPSDSGDRYKRRKKRRSKDELHQKTLGLGKKLVGEETGKGGGPFRKFSLYL